MRERRLNQSQVATYVGTAPSVVNAWLNKGVLPAPETVLRIAQVFDESVPRLHQLLGWLPAGTEVPEPEIDPELARRLTELTRGEQRRLIGAVDLVLELREERASYDEERPDRPPQEGDRP